MDLKCRCMGSVKSDPCLHDADEEDGLCKGCRDFGEFTESGCCEGATEQDVTAYDLWFHAQARGEVDVKGNDRGTGGSETL